VVSKAHLRDGASLRTVVYHPSLAPAIAAVLRAGDAPGTIVACTTENEIAAELERADVLMATRCDLSSVLESSRLRWIQSLASGVEQWFEPPGPPQCPITRMTGVYERYMAEYVVAHILAVTQGLVKLKDAQRSREWLHFDTTSLKGKVLGVAGLGHVGSMIASKAAAFEMTIRGLRRDASKGAASEEIERVFRPDERIEFFHGLDFLVLAMPLTEMTQGFLDAEALNTLPSTAFVVNIGRGGLADEEALTTALVSGQISGAILDTFTVEPLPAESPLWSLANVMVTPHMAGAVHPTEVGAICLRNLIEFASGRVPEPIVDVAHGY
jgi:phosphoglycerate dehydrogenase-like enzyme